jgi:hypothetical protein
MRADGQQNRLFTPPHESRKFHFERRNFMRADGQQIVFYSFTREQEIHFQAVTMEK